MLPYHTPLLTMFMPKYKIVFLSQSQSHTAMETSTSGKRLLVFFLNTLEIIVWNKVFSSSFTQVQTNSFNSYLASGTISEPVCFCDALVGFFFFFSLEDTNFNPWQPIQTIYFQVSTRWNDFGKFEANCSIFSLSVEEHALKIPTGVHPNYKRKQS